MPYRNISYRLYPKTRQKAEHLNKCLGATRFVWNHFLARNKEMYEAHRDDKANPRPSTSFFSLGKEFTTLRQQTDWLQELPYAPIRFVLKRQSDAWKQCFKSGKGFPKFKSWFDDNDSVTFPQGTFKLKGKTLHLSKIGHVVLSGSNPYPVSEPVQVVVKKKLGKFYATVCYEVEDALIKQNDNGESIGIDMNVGQFATSDGEIRQLPDLAKLEAKRRRYQRMMSRRDRGNHKQGIKPSNRYTKAKILAGKTSRKIKNIRSNWQHQESRRIANQAQYVFVEALNTKGMTKSAKGDAENPGTNVKAKSGLNKAILNTGWYGLKQKLDYKAELTEVNPAYTSRMCNQCGHIDKDNRKTQSKFKCVSCGHSDNADINAALNILAFGIRAIGRGDGDISRSVKRQENAQLVCV